MAEELNITELYEEHLALNATMDQVGSWQMPLYYSSIAQEVELMKSSAATIDRGNEVIFRFSGRNASTVLDGRLALPVIALGEGNCSENFLLNVHGGVIAQVWVCYMAKDDFLILTGEEASNSVANHLASLVGKGLKLEELSDYLMRIDLVGEKSLENITQLGTNQCKTINVTSELKAIAANFCQFGVDSVVLIFAEESAKAWWSYLTNTLNLLPSGLLSCEQLRIELGVPAYGSEFNEESLLHEFNYPNLFEPLNRRFFGRPGLERTKPRRHIALCKLDSAETADEQITSISPIPNSSGEYSALYWSK